MRLNVASHTFDEHEGYGRYALSIIRALHDLGVDVKPMYSDTYDWPGDLLNIAGINASTATLWITMPKFLVPSPGINILYTMFEDMAGLPKNWVETINELVDLLIVPCEHNATLFELAGVKKPIVVVYGGVSGDEFPLRTLRQPKDTFIFGALGDRMPRKGTEEVWCAFYDQFPADKYPNVRLCIKTRKDGMLNGPLAINFADKRVSIWREDAPSLKRFFATIDCFVFPSLGEGWGLPPREATLMGVPTIVADNTGLSVGIDCWATRVIKQQRLQRSMLDVPDGMWSVSSIEEVGQHMKWVYESHMDAQHIARAGADWLRSNLTWEHTGRELVKVLQKVVF